jgi:hypothetical protein
MRNPRESNRGDRRRTCRRSTGPFPIGVSFWHGCGEPGLLIRISSSLISSKAAVDNIDEFRMMGLFKRLNIFSIRAQMP